MSCFHNALERSVGKIGDSDGIGAGIGRPSSLSLVVFGKMASRWICVAAIISGRDDRASKSKIGYHRISINTEGRLGARRLWLLLARNLLTKSDCGSWIPGRGSLSSTSKVGSSKPSPKSPKSSSSPA